MRYPAARSVRGAAFLMLVSATQPFVRAISVPAQETSAFAKFAGRWRGHAEHHHHITISRGGLLTPECRDLDVVLRRNLPAPAMLIERSLCPDLV